MLRLVPKNCKIVLALQLKIGTTIRQDQTKADANQIALDHKREKGSERNGINLAHNPRDLREKEKRGQNYFSSTVDFRGRPRI